MNDLTLPERAQRAIAECRRIAAMSEEPGRTTRRFLTPPVREVHALLRGRMEALGMTVRVDAAGNLRGLWQPPGASGKRLILGSHIDTVPNAGAFDGVLGVTLALEWAEMAQELKLPLAIEVIAFSEEEGVRFGVPFLGSRAVAGRFDPALLALKDADGITLEAAIRDFGLDPGANRRSGARRRRCSASSRCTSSRGRCSKPKALRVAAVTAIVGQTRLTLAVHRPRQPRRHHSHASAPRCAGRRGGVDHRGGGAGAERPKAWSPPWAKSNVEPNAGNVIAGAARVSLDVRHADDSARKAAVEALLAQAQAIAERRGLALECDAPDGSAGRADGRAADGFSR